MNKFNIDLLDLGLHFRNWLIDEGLQTWLVDTLGFIVDLSYLTLLVLIADFLSRKILLTFISKLVIRTKATWDDHFYEKRVFRNIAHLPPALIARGLIGTIFNELGDGVRSFIANSVEIYMIVLVAIIINKTLKAIESYAEVKDNKLNTQQVSTVSQVIRILIMFMSVIAVLAVLFDINYGKILGGLAGATAIIILIFQDTINGLLANLQINMYDLIKKGDWITFSKYGVDGDVVSIDLTTVKVQNWDKTISSVPAKAFVFDSFVNWRGMQETNARRIKRNILIDINSVKYADDALLKKFEDVALIKNYIHQTQDEILKFNETHHYNTKVLINGRRQTNIGIYRAYILAYLKQHKQVEKSLTYMVRQLQPTPEGIPLEVYCFSSDIVWENYEKIQSDIFDHLYAATQFFELQLFQSPTGMDIKSLKN